MKVSYSRFSSYLGCPYKHYLSYYECLKLNKVVRPLMFGTDFHKLLELRADQEAISEAKETIKEVYYKLPSSQQSALGENYFDDLLSVFKDYNEVYSDAKQPSITELDFDIKVGSIKGESIIFTGKIDELYKMKSEGQRILKVGEHKTFSKKPDMNTLLMNTQKSLYAKAAYFLYGILPKSVIWDYIKSTPASQPIWLEKSQRFSSAKSGDITPMSWKRACRELKIKDPEVRAQAENYRGNVTNFFFKVELETIPDMVDDIWDGFLYICKDIALRGHKNKTKNVTRDCKGCNYRDICFAEMTGGNRQEIIDRAYIINPREEDSTNVIT